jgi:hypothetical protein
VRIVITPEMLDGVGYLINRVAIRDLELRSCDAPEHTVATARAVKDRTAGRYRPVGTLEAVARNIQNTGHCREPLAEMYTKIRRQPR